MRGAGKRGRRSKGRGSGSRSGLVGGCRARQTGALGYFARIHIAQLSRLKGKGRTVPIR